MNQIYLRVYGGVLGSAFVAILLGVLLFQSLNAVRQEHYQVQRIGPLMSWLVHIQASYSQHWHDGYKVPQLESIKWSDLELSSLQKKRLSFGQVLIEEEGHQLTSYFASAEQVYSLRFDDFYHDINWLMAHVLVTSLNYTDGDGLQDSIAGISDWLKIDAKMLSDDSALSDAEMLEQIVATGEFYQQFETDEAAEGIYRLSDGRLVSVTFHAPYEPLSGWVLLFLIILLTGVLALAVYYLLDSFEQRLKSLESVASRISRGELEARIRVNRSDSIGRLGEAFNRMAEHIQRLVNVQREMIHAVSHELRTPVARIRFGVQMIEDCPDEKSMQKQLAGIDSDIQELDELIDEILTYARLEEGGPILDFQEVDVVAVVNQVVAEQGMVKPHLEVSAEIAVGAEEWRITEAEPRYLHRSIQNLVGNATRYAKSRVVVRCHVDNETCRVDVEDDGPGIPEEDWEKVFTPFARLDDSRTRKSGGYGLGLSIVRRILHWHGGQAFLGRSSMGGARFSLVWPRRQGG